MFWLIEWGLVWFMWLVVYQVACIVVKLVTQFYLKNFLGDFLGLNLLIFFVNYYLFTKQTIYVDRYILVLVGD